MSDLNLLFRNRIGFPINEKITFGNLETVLEMTAKAIPFENLCIISNKTTEITKENLINKIIDKNEGGLCYELNSILHLFLVENGFNIDFIRGVTYNQIERRWNTIGRTHVINVIIHNEKEYIIDTGFGGNLPLKPVPLNGEIVTSNNGEFRVERADSEYGDYIFYMKLMHKDKDWKIGYAFHSTQVTKRVSELNDVQKIILEHPDSPFNKKPLVTRLTNSGSVTLTDTSLTEWADGKVEKEDVDENRFKKIVKDLFGIQSY